MMPGGLVQLSQPFAHENLVGAVRGELVQNRDGLEAEALVKGARSGVEGGNAEPELALLFNPGLALHPFQDAQSEIAALKTGEDGEKLQIGAVKEGVLDRRHAGELAARCDFEAPHGRQLAVKAAGKALRGPANR